MYSRVFNFSSLAMAICAAATGAPEQTAAPVALPPGYFQVEVRHTAMYADFTFTIIIKEGTLSEGVVYAAAQEAFDAIDKLENRISTWKRGTQVSRINTEGAQQPVGVAADVLRLIERSVEYWKATDGAFDITVGPLVELWRRCKEEKRLPTEQELAAARVVVGADKLVVVHEDHSVGFSREGMRLDLNGVAKGAAVDKAAEVLRQYGIDCALLDAGASSFVAIGAPPGLPGWTVRLEDPYNNTTIDESVIRDEAVSTSGTSKEAFEVDGKRYGHIIDPRSGMPVQGMMYAMAIGPDGVLTEALSKGFFVQGVEWTRAYCSAHPETRAILVPQPAEQAEPEPIRINFTK